jgi:putative ABC transport system ATP-binding protein
VIQLSDITLTYPDGEERLVAINHANLTVEPGQIAAITGPSGSGKSSLLAVASTLIQPDSGTVSIDGVDATNLSRKESAQLRRERIGIVFQQSNLLGSLTAIEQLVLMNHLEAGRDPRSRAQGTARARELLEEVGLSRKADKRPGELSGGERQRVNIARAFMNSPAVLIVDEPTSALDQSRGAAIIDLLERLTREHEVATLLVTHDQSHLPQMDQVHHMVDGVLSPEVAVVG